MNVDELLAALKDLSARGFGEYALTVKLLHQQVWISDIHDPDTDQLEVELEVSA